VFIRGKKICVHPWQKRSVFIRGKNFRVDPWQSLQELKRVARGTRG
jgi:hypothetical protein